MNNQFTERIEILQYNLISMEAELAHVRTLALSDTDCPEPPAWWLWWQGMHVQGWEWYDVKEWWYKGKAHIHTADAAMLYARCEYPPPVDWDDINDPGSEVLPFSEPVNDYEAEPLKSYEHKRPPLPGNL